MIIPEQPEIDWEAAASDWPLREQWARNAAAQAGDWTEEALCLAWVTQSDGRHWRDWWAGLANYEREQIINCYRFEREFADSIDRPMRPYKHFEIDQQQIGDDRAIIERFKADIINAAVQGRPMPITAGEDMKGKARSRYFQRIFPSSTSTQSNSFS
jgi:hypothetical protein